MGAFEEPSSNQPEMSLADIARKYKAQRASAHPRQFDNSSIRHASYGTADTNAASLPQGDQAGTTYGSTGNASAPAGVMNSGDYAAVQAALARSQAANNINSSNNTVATAMPDPNRSTNDGNEQQAVPANTSRQGSTAQSTNDATTPQVNKTATTSNPPASKSSKKQLPASGSPLPLIGMLGLIALAAGGVFTYRARSSEYR
jgi:cobalamin biosynthesis Mg chelatase CobN